MYMTVGSDSKMCCVPFPWWMSQSMMSTLRAPDDCAARAATAALLK
jgi:hypothetical protein